MNADLRLSRRHVLGTAVAAGAFTLAGQVGSVFAQQLKRTPNEILGPFYPVLRSVEKSADLTIVAGRPGRATGEVIYVMGRVLDVQGQPVKGARVELWQANARGRYTHPSDTNPAPLDANFEGFAIQDTDAEGRYRFKTIKPGAYPATPNWMRPPHLHFEVIGKINRMITQMYFPGRTAERQGSPASERPRQPGRRDREGAAADAGCRARLAPRAVGHRDRQGVDLARGDQIGLNGAFILRTPVSPMTGEPPCGG